MPRGILANACGILPAVVWGPLIKKGIHAEMARNLALVLRDVFNSVSGDGGKKQCFMCLSVILELMEFIL